MATKHRLITLSDTIEIPPPTPDPVLALSRAGKEVSNAWVNDLKPNEVNILTILEQMHFLSGMIEQNLLRGQMDYLIDLLILEEQENVRTDGQ